MTFEEWEDVVGKKGWSPLSASERIVASEAWKVAYAEGQRAMRERIIVSHQHYCVLCRTEECGEIGNIRALEVPNA